MRRLALLAAAVLAPLALRAGAANISLRGPTVSPLGPIDEQGRFIVSFYVARVPLAENFSMELWAHFYAADDEPSPYLGWGWKFWPLEAYAKEAPAGAGWDVALPTGRKFRLAPVPGQPGKFEYFYERWTGAVEAGDFVLRQEEGWELRYSGGRLQRLRDAAGRDFEWAWRDGRVLQISALADPDGVPPLRVATADDGTVNGFYISGNLHRITLQPRPRGLPGAGVPPPAAVPSLAAWEWPGGGRETFVFGVDEGNGTARLTRTDREAVARIYTWDFTSRELRLDGKWTFVITPPPNAQSPPGIYRSTADGERHFLIRDNVAGRQEQKMTDFHAYATWHTAPGPLQGKPIAQGRMDEKGVETPITQYTYNARGHVVRVSTAQAEYAYEVDEQGVPLRRTVTRARTAAQQQRLEEREAELLAQLDAAPGDQRLLTQLITLYLRDLRLPAKVGPLLGQLADDDARFPQRLALLTTDDHTTHSEKIAALRQWLADQPERAAELNRAIANTERSLDSLLRYGQE